MTVGDADTLWHPQFFSAATFESQRLTEEERSWSIWQPPVLPLRNFNTVDSSDGLLNGTVMFELASLMNQHLGSHLAHSSCAVPLSLACHRLVQAWDSNVIAENSGPSTCQRFRFWWSRTDGGHRWWSGSSRHGATHRVSLNLGTCCFSILRLMATGSARQDVHHPHLQLRSGIFCRGHGVDGHPENPGVGVVRWLVSCRRESYGSGYRSDHRRRILKRVVVFCSFRTTAGFSHRCDSVSGDQRCVGGPLHERCDRADEGLLNL